MIWNSSLEDRWAAQPQCQFIFPDYFFCKIIELTCDPCYPHDGTLREHVRSSSSFLRSTIGAFLFRFVVGRLHLSKAYFRFSRSAGGVVFKCCSFVINQLYYWLFILLWAWTTRSCLVSSTRHPSGPKVSIHSCLILWSLDSVEIPFLFLCGSTSVYAPLQVMWIPSICLFEGDWRRPKFIWSCSHYRISRIAGGVFLLCFAISW